jgi:hypothetical protein
MNNPFIYMILAHEKDRPDFVWSVFHNWQNAEERCKELNEHHSRGENLRWSISGKEAGDKPHEKPLAELKTYEIHFYHGRSDQLEEKINRFCHFSCFPNGKQGWVFKGSLDDFQKNYKSHFMVDGGNIYITQYRRFSCR